MRREILGIVFGSIVSCAILAALILHVLPADRIEVEALPEGTPVPSSGVMKPDLVRRA
jgi:hypothetical protein